jgi:hypothetical protein
MRDTYRNLEHGIFEGLVKTTWLHRRFMYDGKRRKHTYHNGFPLDRAFGIFMRNYVGYENRLMYRGTRAWAGRIISYLDDLFPNFDESNPFLEDYAYPYKNVTLGHMSLVYQMGERLDLLERADRDNMNYAVFTDYVLNWAYMHNERLDSDKYMLNTHQMLVPYVVDLYKENAWKKGKSKDKAEKKYEKKANSI